MNSQLAHKIEQTKMVLEEMLDTYPAENILLAWSAGKDSTLVLALLLEICQARGITMPRALDIDPPVCGL